MRTPNILLDEKLTVKIADFSLSDNFIYQGMNSTIIYTKLIPPECQSNINNFSKKGDVYVIKF